MTWTDISNTQVDPGSPVDTALMTALRDNDLAVAAGDGGAYAFLSSASVTASVASVDITLDTTNYDDFKLVFSGVSQSSGFALELLTSSDGGSTFASSSSNYANGVISSDTDNVKLTNANFFGGADSDVGGFGYFETIDAASALRQTVFRGLSSSGDISSFQSYDIAGTRRSSSVVNAFRLKSAFGDLARINYWLYGLKRSTVVV